MRPPRRCRGENLQCDALRAENERLRARLAESEAENDQWQKKLADVWAEVDELRQQHNAEGT